MGGFGSLGKSFGIVGTGPGGTNAYAGMKMPGYDAQGQPVSPEAYLKSMQYDFNGNPAPIGSPTNVLSSGRSEPYANPSPQPPQPYLPGIEPTVAPSPALPGTIARTPPIPFKQSMTSSEPQQQEAGPQFQLPRLMTQLISALQGGR